MLWVGLIVSLPVCQTRVMEVRQFLHIYKWNTLYECADGKLDDFFFVQPAGFNPQKRLMYGQPKGFLTVRAIRMWNILPQLVSAGHVDNIKKNLDGQLSKSNNQGFGNWDLGNGSDINTKTHKQVELDGLTSLVNLTNYGTIFP